MSEKTGEPRQKRILILCVDRDCDLGTKANIKTPLLGRNANLDAAVSLALNDPEEADANAMFEAVSLHDRLVKENNSGEVFEVATICGTELGGVGADRKLVAELGTLLETFSADEVILVTDGYSDEAIMPLIESRVPVSSVRRIVVKHSESIEETAALFSRYMKMLVQEPRYSRIALGLPGLLILIWSILAILKVDVYYYAVAIILVVGSFMLIKGFGVDRSAKNAYKWAREYSPPPLPVQISNYATIAGVLCIAISAYSGYIAAIGGVNPLPVDTAGWLSSLPTFAGYFLKGSLDLIIVGLSTILVGRSVPLYFNHDARLLRNTALIVSMLWSRMIFVGAADVLISPALGYANLIFYIVVGILIAIASVLVMLIVQRSAKGFFSKPKEKIDEYDDETEDAKEKTQEEPQ
jgi:putative membrane protein